MADNSGPELPYGHFGLAQYSRHSHGWQFERKTPARTAITPFLALHSAHSSHKVPNDNTSDEAVNVRSVRYAKQIAALSQSHTDIQAPDDLLPALLRESEAVQDAVNQVDSASGDLMAFAYMKDLRSPGSVRIGFTVDAKVRSRLVCTVMTTQRLRLCDDRRYCLEVPSLQGKVLSWSTAGAPIQQVCCAGQVNANLRIGMRHSEAVQILSFRMPKHRSTRLEPELVLEGSVVARKVGLGALTNIAFNPWTPHQLSLIDREGNWRIFDLNRDRVEQLCTSNDAHVIADDRSRLGDGWTRIEWIVNAAAATILVCTRFKAAMFSVADESARHIEDIDDLRLPSRLPWILDFKVLPQRSEHFVFLTPTHVMLYKASRVKFGALHASCIAQTQHFMNAEDMSMRLTLSQEQEGAINPVHMLIKFADFVADTLLIVSSTISSVILMYRITFIEDDAVIIHDPQQIRTSITTTSEIRTDNCIQISLKPLQLRYKSVEGRTYGIDGQAHFAPCGQSTRFYSMLLLHHDLHTSEFLALSRDETESIPRFQFVQTMAEASGPHMIPADQSRYIEAVTQDDHVVRRGPRPRLYRRVDHRQKAYQHPKDFRPLCHLLNASSNLTIERLLLEEAYEYLDQDLSRDVRANQVLSELVEIDLTTGDIEEAADALRQFSESLRVKQPDVENDAEATTYPALMLVPSITKMMPKHEDDFSEILSLYNSLVATYISPLSQQVSGRSRVAKDRLVRMLAAELTMSGLVVRQQDRLVEHSQVPEHGVQTSTLELPFRGQRGDPFHVPASSGALPTPPPTTPSITTASSRTSLLAAPEVDRLRRYATFSKAAPHPLPRALSNVLDHWNLGEDPSSYDWLSTSREISRRGIATDDEMTEQERRRVRRKAERLLSRQRKEVAASQALRVASSQAPEILSASQPPVLRSAVPSATQRAAVPASSQSISNADYLLPAASQPVPGRFGGRPPLKKKRKQGF